MLLIVNNTNADEVILANSPENLYNSMYQLFSDENFTAVLEKNRYFDPQYQEEILKFKLLKANAIGKQKV
jgi:hypothetical protein